MGLSIVSHVATRSDHLFWRGIFPFPKTLQRAIGVPPWPWKPPNLWGILEIGISTKDVQSSVWDRNQSNQSIGKDCRSSNWNSIFDHFRSIYHRVSQPVQRKRTHFHIFLLQLLSLVQGIIRSMYHEKSHGAPSVQSYMAVYETGAPPKWLDWCWKVPKV